MLARDSSMNSCWFSFPNSEAELFSILIAPTCRDIESQMMKFQCSKKFIAGSPLSIVLPEPWNEVVLVQQTMEADVEIARMYLIVGMHWLQELGW